MLAEEDDLARGADEPLPVLVRPGSVRMRIVQCELFDGTTDGVWEADVIVRSERDGTCIKEGMLQVVDEIRRILDADAETDEILRETPGSTRSRINRRVSAQDG